MIYLLVKGWPTVALGCTKMEILKTEKRDIIVIEAYVCNSCKKRIDDLMEMQEMMRWRTVCGYGSIFGDGVKLSMDLCQDCIKKHLGDFITIEEETTLYTL